MPTLDKSFTLTVTPEQFLNACSQSELWEINTLLSSPKFYEKMYGTAPAAEPEIDFGDANLTKRIEDIHERIHKQERENEQKQN